MNQTSSKRGQRGLLALMPELPEVETIRRDLHAELVGRTLTRVMVTGARTVRRHERRHLTETLAERTVLDTRRLGKFLVVDFADDVSMVVHLRMSGQLLWQSSIAPLVKHTHARFFFGTGESELRFVDPRTFGELWVTKPDLPDLWHIGRDALLDTPSAGDLRAILATRRSSLKTLLLNQSLIAGIGNIYGDEILWTAELRPDRLPEKLQDDDYVRLHNSIGDVLGRAVDERGSSLRDQQYVDLYGRIGAAQRTHSVHARAGQACMRCGNDIMRAKVGGRTSYFCSHCQR